MPFRDGTPIDFIIYISGYKVMYNALSGTDNIARISLYSDKSDQGVFFGTDLIANLYFYKKPRKNVSRVYFPNPEPDNRMYFQVDQDIDILVPMLQILRTEYPLYWYWQEKRKYIRLSTELEKVGEEEFGYKKENKSKVKEK